MEKLNDKWIRIGSIILLLFNLFIVDNGPGARPFKYEVIYILLYLVFITAIMETGRWIIRSMHRKYASFQETRKRFWKSCLFVSLSNIVLIPFTYNLFHWLRGMTAGNHPAFLLICTIGGFILALVQTGIYESFYNFNRLGKLEKEREELLRVNLQSRFDSLKQQVNPHFLFNSINTVSSLISIDPARAKKFLAEMSKVYRYLLKANEEELTTLDKELDFLRSYFHLLKTRFGDGLQMQTAITDDSRNDLLPVLSLQLLLENAVKHNVIEPQRPLIITIESVSGDFLSIRNNLQKKLNVVDSNKVGLSTIIARYTLLKQGEPVIRQTETEFIVLLPLIKTYSYERVNY
jgi:two-component system LytT family sensor kinase